MRDALYTACTEYVKHKYMHVSSCLLLTHTLHVLTHTLHLLTCTLHVFLTHTPHVLPHTTRAEYVKLPTLHLVTV